MTTSTALAYAAHKAIQNPAVQTAVLGAAKTVVGTTISIVSTVAPVALPLVGAEWLVKKILE